MHPKYLYIRSFGREEWHGLRLLHLCDYEKVRKSELTRDITRLLWEDFSKYVEAHIGQSVNIDVFWKEISAFTVLTEENIRLNFLNINKAVSINSVRAVRPKPWFCMELNK